jgi:hypothetical protein
VGGIMEKKIYQIIIGCLLVLLAVLFLTRGKPNQWQISGNICINTLTGETYSFEQTHWVYWGKPKKEVDIEQIKSDEEYKQKIEEMNLDPETKANVTKYNQAGFSYKEIFEYLNKKKGGEPVTH